MTLSMIFAWCALLCAALAALRYAARVSKKPGLNRFFHKIHIPAGLLALSFGLVHGLLAGNFPGEKVEWGSVIFTPNWGTLSFLLMIFLLVSCHLKKPLKKKWMLLHRILTVLLAAVLALHLWDMGIHLFDRPGGKNDGSGAASSAVSLPEPQIERSPSPTPAGTPESSPAKTSPSPTAASPDPTSAPSPTPEPTPEEIQALFSGAVLADGVYTGSAQGHQSTIGVEVTVERGQVASIAVVEQNETPKYFSRARSVLDEIALRQSLDVDAVTGATHSSEGLVNAVRDALSGAIIEGELS